MQKIEIPDNRALTPKEAAQTHVMGEAIIAYETSGSKGLGILVKALPAKFAGEGRVGSTCYGFAYQTELLRGKLILSDNLKFRGANVAEAVSAATRTGRNVYIFTDIAEFHEYAKNFSVY